MGQRRAVHAANRTCCHRARADIEPDLKVRAAMNEINAAQRLRHVPVHCTITALSMQDSCSQVLHLCTTCRTGCKLET